MNTAEEEKRRERRDHRRRNRLRNKKKSDAIVEEVLVRFLERLSREEICVDAAESGERVSTLRSFRELYQVSETHNAKSHNAKYSVDWNSFPADADPVTRIGVLKKNAKARGLRKRKQVEQIYDLLRSRDLLGVAGERRKKIVDFGCGTGNLLLALAHLFPEHDFVGVDLKHTSIRLLNERIQEAQLTNVRAELSLIESFDEEFDVALALHVCGNATDAVLSACVERGKSFVCVPCCVGKIQANGHRSVGELRKRLINSAVAGEVAGEVASEVAGEAAGEAAEEESTGLKIDLKTDLKTDLNTIHYPRSALMRSICDEKTFMSVAKLADWSGNEEVSAYEDTSHLILPTRAKEAVEIDRAQRCKEEGYNGSVSLHKLHGCGLRNDLILGVIK